MPENRVRVLLENATPKSAKFFGADVTGAELRAVDLDWSFRTGTPVSGTAGDLLLLLFGRKLPPGRLQEDAPARFTAARDGPVA
ncbi:hypothetical protein ACH427_29190 [Streptomyces sp. NPDC020379]|uniref:hypothetical protein n=1 Tax=Streptomyces sp. NPDC020379 TaxID=3365071 RepID=UPI0037A0E021